MFTLILQRIFFLCIQSQTQINAGTCKQQQKKKRLVKGTSAIVIVAGNDVKCIIIIIDCVVIRFMALTLINAFNP